MFIKFYMDYAITTRSFASDNNSAVIPEAINVINSVNRNHVGAYGNDPITKMTQELFQSVFGKNSRMYLAFNGTGANHLCLMPFLKSYESVICSELSHINNDECGSPERIIGTKLLAIPSDDGKITLDGIREKLVRLGDHHHVQPRVISITQPTEVGTLYSIDELKAICTLARENGLVVHMDGTRLVHAACALDCSLKALTCDVGIDCLSFGGTKNGLLLAEACVFFNGYNVHSIPYYQKQLLQLPGKSRFVSAQFYAFLKDNTWLKYSKNSLKMAKLLEASILNLGIEVTQKVETNMVFAKIPKQSLKKARENYFFYVWDESPDEDMYEVRWVTCFDTSEEDVKNFVASLKAL